VGLGDGIHVVGMGVGLGDGINVKLKDGSYSGVLLVGGIENGELGAVVCVVDGIGLGEAEGIDDGLLVGNDVVGIMVGLDDGMDEGLDDGFGVVGFTEGLVDGFNEGLVDGFGAVGIKVGLRDGINEGLEDRSVSRTSEGGPVDGEVGEGLCEVDGIGLGEGEGNDGLLVGTDVVGILVGLGDGINEGLGDGISVVGMGVGLGDGINEGLGDGLDVVGIMVGLGDGITVGFKFRLSRLQSVSRTNCVHSLSLSLSSQ